MLDWLLCFPVQSNDSAHLEKLVEAWGGMRKKVWELLLNAEEDGTLELDGNEARQLMAMIPTTFRWASGPDHGLNLKTKIANALWGPDEEQVAATRAVEELLQEGGGRDGSGTSANKEAGNYEPEYNVSGYNIADEEDNGPVAAG